MRFVGAWYSPDPYLRAVRFCSKTSAIVCTRNTGFTRLSIASGTLSLSSNHGIASVREVVSFGGERNLFIGVFRSESGSEGPCTPPDRARGGKRHEMRPPTGRTEKRIRLVTTVRLCDVE